MSFPPDLNAHYCYKTVGYLGDLYRYFTLFFYSASLMFTRYFILFFILTRWSLQDTSLSYFPVFCLVDFYKIHYLIFPYSSSLIFTWYCTSFSLTLVDFYMILYLIFWYSASLICTFATVTGHKETSRFNWLGNRFLNDVKAPVASKTFFAKICLPLSVVTHII